MSDSKIINRVMIARLRVLWVVFSIWHETHSKLSTVGVPKVWAQSHAEDPDRLYAAIFTTVTLRPRPHELRKLL